ncbi:hypothetical protein BN1708_019061, partial [Verticillium longisporum]
PPDPRPRLQHHNAHHRADTRCHSLPGRHDNSPAGRQGRPPRPLPQAGSRHPARPHHRLGPPAPPASRRPALALHHLPHPRPPLPRAARRRHPPPLPHAGRRPRRRPPPRLRLRHRQPRLHPQGQPLH